MEHPQDEPVTTVTRLKRIVFGPPRDLGDRSIFHRISLIPFLAWVGLGADGLSSSAYGPEEAFRALGHHSYLATLLAIAVVGTVIVISSAYSHIIEQFPTGGGDMSWPVSFWAKNWGWFPVARWSWTTF